ncbi:hypothetical protein RYX36_029435 [Vicia faba]
MDSHLPQNNFSDKQQAKRPIPSPPPPQFPKKERTKSKAIKETPDARVSKKKSSKSQIVETLFHKFIGLNKKFNPNNVKHFYCNLVKNIGEDRLKAPKIMDYFGVSNMRYYRDTNVDYYYLEEYSQKVYDDKIVDPIKDPSNDASGSFSSLLFAYVKSCIDELVGKIFDNQIREERIMAHIDNMA